MSDGITSRLASCVTALEKVIGPAVAPLGDPLAAEQARLVAQYVAFIDGRLDYLVDRSHHELGGYLEMAREVAGVLAESGEGDGEGEGDGDHDGELARAIEAATAVHARTRPRASALDAATAQVRAQISRIVRGLSTRDRDDPLRRAIHELVLRRSRALIDLQRAWFSPLGWDENAVDPPVLDELLGQ